MTLWWAQTTNTCIYYHIHACINSTHDVSCTSNIAFSSLYFHYCCSFVRMLEMCGGSFRWYVCAFTCVLRLCVLSCIFLYGQKQALKQMFVCKIECSSSYYFDRLHNERFYVHMNASQSMQLISLNFRSFLLYKFNIIRVIYSIKHAHWIVYVVSWWCGKSHSFVIVHSLFRYQWTFCFIL